MSTPLLRTGICACGGKGYFILARETVPCPKCNHAYRPYSRRIFEGGQVGDLRTGVHSHRYDGVDWALRDDVIAKQVGVTKEAVYGFRKRWGKGIERRSDSAV